MRVVIVREDLTGEGVLVQRGQLIVLQVQVAKGEQTREGPWFEDSDSIG